MGLCFARETSHPCMHIASMHGETSLQGIRQGGWRFGTPLSPLCLAICLWRVDDTCFVQRVQARGSQAMLVSQPGMAICVEPKSPLVLAICGCCAFK